MAPRTRIALPIGLAFAAVTAVLCSRAPLPEVEVAPVRRDDLAVVVSTNGKIEPIDELDVRARLAGRVLEIPEPGTRLKAGELLLRIDSGPVAAELAAAQSERLSSLESLREARQTLARVEKRAATDSELFRNGAVTREHFDEGQQELEAARRRVAFLESEVPVRVASLDLRIAELSAQRDAAEARAPFRGTVYRREVKAGAMVRPGDPVLRFADLDRLRVRANVDQVDLGRVGPDQRMRIAANAFPGRSWSAVVEEVVPHVVLKDTRSVAESLATIEAPTAGLVPGMTVDVEILVDASSDALQVPAEAVFVADGRHFVYRVEGGRALRTPVSLGRSSVGSSEVLEGLEEGQLVVVGSAGGLEDGARVEQRALDVAAE